MMVTLISRTKVLAGLIFLFLLGSNLLAAQENNNDVSRQLTELEGFYAEEKIKLKEQSEELDRLLDIGYSGVALGKDMKNVAEEVESVQARINDLKQQLDELAEGMNINPIMAFEVIPRHGAKDAPALTAPVSAGEILYFTADIAAGVEEGIETRLNWSIVTPDGKLSEKLKKTQDILLENSAGSYSFGINTRGLEDGQYWIRLEHHVIEKPDHKHTAMARFDLGLLSELKIIKLVVDDEKTGDEHQSVLAMNATPFLFSYYQTPPDITALTASYRVWDITAKKEIYKKTGRRQNKPDIDTQRVGIRLDPGKNSLVEGHEYRFDISFTDNLRPDSSGKKYKKVKDSITFFYGSEPRYVKIDRLVAGPDKDAKTFAKDIPLLTSPLYLNAWLRSAKSIDKIDVDISLVKTKNKSVIFETSVTKKNNEQQGLYHLSFPVAADLLKAGTKYRLEVAAKGEDLEPVTLRRSFTYAPKPPVDMSKYIKVSGVIKTPGLPDVIISSASDLRYRYRHNSTITLTAPPIYPDGVDGELQWACKNCGAKRKTIPLDGSMNDWSYSYSPGKKRWGGKIELFHKREKLYTARFGLEKPFNASIFTDQKKQSLEIGDVGIKLKANSHATNITVTAKAVLKNTGETLFNETKSISLSADKDVKWLWHIDPDKLKYDIEQYFPKIKSAHGVKNISLEVTVDDGKGYKTSRTRTLTRKIFVLKTENFKDGPRTPDNPLVSTIIPPAGMKGPFKTSITGISTYYMDGLKWYYDPERLQAWVNEVGVKKYKETKDKISYRKTVPLLITIEDSTGKEAVVFWKKYNYSVHLWKEELEEE